MKRRKRISAFREFMLLLEEGSYLLLGETRNLISSLLFPPAAALVTVWIAGENMFDNFESTKSACFILVCAAIWCGLFNSIQVVVKERGNIKRDYVSGAMRLGCYTGSRTLLQMILCAVQSAMLCMTFVGICTIYDHSMPRAGLIYDNIMIELYISVFLLMCAADALGLMISCIVKSEQLASQLSPYVLIVQLLFSGVLFPVEGAASGVSAIMLSRWGMEALGSTCDLNGLPLRLQAEFPMLTHEAESAFLYTADHLSEVWIILFMFIIVPVAVGNFVLYKVKDDSR